MGSKGILEGIKGKDLNIEAEKNLHSKEVKNLEELGYAVKRSFNLKPATVKVLQEIKLKHPDLSITLSELVDESINLFYQTKYSK